MPTAVSVFETERASRYLQQLCKHFAHKVPATHSETEGRAELPGGVLTLTATPAALRMEVKGEGARELAKARYILEDHLLRFAFREGLMGLDWRYEAD
ncbi:MAG: DUF2218 domain-containing protein [Alphaproteobacteria bacterium]